MRPLILASALALGAAACSGGGDTTTVAPTTVPGPTTTTSFVPQPADFTTGWRAVNLPETQDFQAVPLAVLDTPDGWLAVGIDAQDRAAVWTSPDGVDWARLAHDPAFDGAAMADVVAGGPGLVAVGATATGGRFTPATEQAVVWTSADGGQSWRRIDSSSFNGAGMTAVTAGGPGLVAVGGDGATVVIWTSPDGETWQRVPDQDGIRAGATARSIVPGGEGLVVVGADDALDGAVWTSSDGAGWRRVVAAPAVFRSSPVFDAAERGGVLVAVGQTLAENGAAVWNVTDGGWERVPLGEPFLGATLLGVTAGSGGFVAHGLDARDGPAFWWSTDGASWEQVPGEGDLFSGFTFIRDVAYGPGGIVAIGDVPGGMTAWRWASG